ncbi:hypothetical protein PPL_10811 [Heterostelium album PN500]|uniref:F-box domain-containing protein n=1 Tax=Heterostelium pallidum (strain ATCC 26659 / Pp 5 / PN500) TaxID=670386 RepID=D3BS19_HETP5|nr:hypothetical protein PPL_10811 [Heterostelium album PN500]EFA75756.1 hypothetical protein PPL_10811 [Heterostelium album PN500]|eukprot:XP_020427890.1 hypothetical protein PPL_10811 [Heterostelium album PN500]
MSNNNSNNSTHKLVNLPHILLSNIVDNLTDNIDKICFSLVCKRWFDNRNRYLLFDTSTLYCIDKHSSRITLNSFRSLIFESLSKKKQCTMFVDPEANYFKRYDHLMDYDSIESIDEIDQNIVEVIIRSREIKDSDKLMARLYDLISKSNITSIKDCHTLKYVPANITSLVIGVGVLPDTLESFEMFNIYQILEPGVLPTSLKILRILGRSAPDNYLKVGSLPPNLQEFIHNGSDFNIDSNVLPNSLITLENVPVSWMKSIKQLENLRSLMLVGNSGSLLDLSDLPQSLTRLDISNSVKLQSALPTSIRHLNLGNSKYDIDELFPDRSLYHFDYLQVAGFKQESLDGLNIKRLCLNNNFPYTEERSDTHRDIPFGVETLEILYHNKINQKSLPSSVKTLVVDNMQNFIRPEEGILPDSVQNIELKQLLFPTTKMVDNISFKVDDYNKCSIRKLDDQYYIVFGHQNNIGFIASLFHKSMFLDKVKVLKILTSNHKY